MLRQYSLHSWLAVSFCLVLFTNALYSQTTTRFSLLGPRETGIDFNNKIKDTKERNILLYANFYGGAGVGVGDFNNDGLQDIFFAGNIVPDKLYLNQGNFNFKDVTKNSGILNDGGWSTGVTVADINNDGHLDIYVSRELYDDRPEWRANLLYINKGDGTFSESAETYGVADTERTRHATFLDYDKDGLLDLFLLTQPPNPGSYSEFFGSVLLKPEYHLTLLKNTGKDHFVDVSEAAGLNSTGFPNGVSASDLNNDGWTDLYVANDFYAPDFLFINNQDGTFTNVANEALGHMSYYSMGVDVADINNDDLLDIFVVDMVAEDNFRLKSNMSGMNPNSFWKVVKDGGHYQYMYNALQLNNGNATFSDVAQLTGMAATDWSWANLIADFDNDGLKDTYITNGLLRDIRNTDADKSIGQYITQTANNWVRDNPNGGDISIWDILDLEKALSLVPSQPLKNYAYKNKGDLKFDKIAKEWGLDQASFSNGAAYADFDNDGDLDIVVNNINKKAFVYKNNSEKFPHTNYLRVHLSDNENKPVLGARIKLYADNGVQTFETTNVRGIYSTSESAAHFGLGDKVSVDSVVVLWPNNTKSIKRQIAGNQTIHMTPNGDKASVHTDKNNTGNQIFEDVTKSFKPGIKHQENTFDDFEYQVLLPHKLSQLGPALAKGDVNNDGLEDFFIGGASDISAKLYVQDKAGEFNAVSKEFWKKEAAYEDIDAVFVDINNDGYQDLYVVSGGNEYPANDLHYVDRIYMNDGQGNFLKGAIMQVGRASGSKVIPGDYDGDGDTDLFVGGRHVPHHYPLPASSMLLINENGQLINASNQLAPDLKDIGMVTDAEWDDYDGDGDVDLVVVGEWMPITLLENEGGTLTKVDKPGLLNTAGWWFSISKGDFDNDGDSDFIAGNLGLNYKYKTSTEAPFDIYYNDFDGNGNYDIVLGYYEKNKHYPLRGFSCSAQQVPVLKSKIKKYDVFAAMEIDQVYGTDNLDNSLHYKADTFASSYIENLGNGRFKISPLPALAQVSNINDMQLIDLNSDGNLDVVSIGNFFVSEIETPRNDAGTGLVLMGDGKGKFTPLSGNESGLFARGDAKKVEIIQSGGKKKLMVANNNDELQIFAIKD